MDLGRTSPRQFDTDAHQRLPCPPFRVGQRLEAAVNALLDERQNRIDIGGARLEVRTSVATTVDQDLDFEVIGTNQHIVLNIVSPSSASNPMTAASRKPFQSNKTCKPYSPG